LIKKIQLPRRNEPTGQRKTRADQGLKGNISAQGPRSREPLLDDQGGDPAVSIEAMVHPAQRAVPVPLNNPENREEDAAELPVMPPRIEIGDEADQALAVVAGHGLEEALARPRTGTGELALGVGGDPGHDGLVVGRLVEPPDSELDPMLGARNLLAQELPVYPGNPCATLDRLDRDIRVELDLHHLVEDEVQLGFGRNQGGRELLSALNYETLVHSTNV